MTPAAAGHHRQVMKPAPAPVPAPAALRRQELAVAPALVLAPAAVPAPAQGAPASGRVPLRAPQPLRLQPLAPSYPARQQLRALQPRCRATAWRPWPSDHRHLHRHPRRQRPRPDPGRWAWLLPPWVLLPWAAAWALQQWARRPSLAGAPPAAACGAVPSRPPAASPAELLRHTQGCPTVRPRSPRLPPRRRRHLRRHGMQQRRRRRQMWRMASGRALQSRHGASLAHSWQRAPALPLR